MRSMRFQSDVVVETLQGLERDLTEHRAHLAQMTTALSGGRFSLALEVADKLRDGLARVDAMYKRLHANVVPADDLGSCMESLGELALRGRRMVILAQLGQLRTLLREPGAAARTQGWFVGEFRNIDDVDRYFDEVFRKINGIWMQFREDPAEVSGVPRMERFTLQRTAVLAAQRALGDVRHHADLAHLLRAGLDTADWPAALAAFTAVVVAISVQIDMESRGTPMIPVPLARKPDATPAREPRGGVTPYDDRHPSR